MEPDSHTDPSDPWVGRTVGRRFLVSHRIGQGGMGIVYLARDLERGRDVAIKLLAPRLRGDPTAFARFEREGDQLGRLRHPHIVEGITFDRTDGHAYLVMEYLSGRSLRAHLDRRGRIPAEEFVALASQILHGVAHAHARDIMVRDIKPSNIMLCPTAAGDVHVKLLDFGLAKRCEGDVSLTSGHVLGTVGYLAPEAIRGARPDLRVDVYSLGVLFYTMLTGGMPCGLGDEATIFHRTVHRDPPRIETLLPPDDRPPASLAELIHRCLDRDPERRPTDANMVLEALIDAVPRTWLRPPSWDPDPGPARRSSLGLSATRPIDPRQHHRTPLGSPRRGLLVATIGATALSMLTGMGLGLRDGPAESPASVRGFAAAAVSRLARPTGPQAKLGVWVVDGPARATAPRQRRKRVRPRLPASSRRELPQPGSAMTVDRRPTRDLDLWSPDRRGDPGTRRSTDGAVGLEDLP